MSKSSSVVLSLWDKDDKLLRIIPINSNPNIQVNLSDHVLYFTHFGVIHHFSIDDVVRFSIDVYEG